MGNDFLDSMTDDIYSMTSFMFEKSIREVFALSDELMGRFDLDEENLRNARIDPDSISSLYSDTFKEDFDSFSVIYEDLYDFPKDELNMETVKNHNEIVLKELKDLWNKKCAHIKEIILSRASRLSEMYYKVSNLVGQDAMNASYDVISYARILCDRIDVMVNRNIYDIDKFMYSAVEKNANLDDKKETRIIKGAVSSLETGGKGGSKLTTAYNAVPYELDFAEELRLRNHKLSITAESLSTSLALADIFHDKEHFDAVTKRVMEALDSCKTSLDFEQLSLYMQAYASKGGFASEYYNEISKLIDDRLNELDLSEKKQENVQEPEVLDPLSPKEMDINLCSTAIANIKREAARMRIHSDKLDSTITELEQKIDEVRLSSGEYTGILKDELDKLDKVWVSEVQGITERKKESQKQDEHIESKQENSLSGESNASKQQQQEIVNVLRQVVLSKAKSEEIKQDLSPQKVLDDYEQSKNKYEEVSASNELSQTIQGKTSSEIDKDLDEFEKQEKKILNSKHFTDEKKRELLDELYSEFDQYTAENPEINGRKI
ncbi:MAG: hypothetical protein IKG27_02595 [Bacilli bacterium]|nr:hypothetical protein [Bacilli bacterium]